MPNTEPILVKKDYKGFSITKFGIDYYGLSQSEGAFDINKVKERKYRQFVVGQSVMEVEQQIDRLIEAK